MHPAVRPAVAVRSAGYQAVAVAAAAAGAAPLDPATQAAVSLLRQVAQEQCVHRTLEADMQLADLALRDRHQPYAGEGQLLEQASGVLLVAREPVQGLGDHRLVPTGAD